MEQCYTIFRHEIQKLVLDQKTLMSIFLLPLLTVSILALISYGTGDEVKTSYRVFVLDNAAQATTIESEDGQKIEMIPLESSTYDEAKAHDEIQEEDVVVKFDDGEATVYFNSTNEIAQTLSDFPNTTVDVETGVNSVFANVPLSFSPAIVSQV